MKYYWERTEAEREIMHAAYEWEVARVFGDDDSPNPYAKEIMAMGLWEAFNDAVEMAFR